MHFRNSKTGTLIILNYCYLFRVLKNVHKFIIFSHFLDISKQLDSTILIHTDTLACFVETKLFLLNAVEMASAARGMASVGELRFSFVCF